MNNCIFCPTYMPPKDRERLLVRNDLAYVMWDGFPVTPHHALIIPVRHVSSFFDLSQKEAKAILSLLDYTKQHIEIIDHDVSGFNVGINIGKSAGQSIFHCHVHLIPRRDGDLGDRDPRGGVRHVIPDRGYYHDTTTTKK